MVADGAEWVRTFRPDAFGIEANQFQELLGDQFAAEFRRQRLWNVAYTWSIEEPREQTGEDSSAGGLAGASDGMRFKTGLAGDGVIGRAAARVSGRCIMTTAPTRLEMAIRLADQLCDGPADDGLGSRLPVGE